MTTQKGGNSGGEDGEVDMAKTRRTPSGGLTKTGPQREESKPLARGGSDPAQIERLELENETSGPAGRPRSASSGAEDMYALDAERIPDEEPTNVSANTIRSFGGDEDEED